MWSAILLAGTRSPVIGEIKNCSLTGCAVAVGLEAEMKNKMQYMYVHIYVRKPSRCNGAYKIFSIMHYNKT